MTPSSSSAATFAAAVYVPKTGDRTALHRFVDDIKTNGVKVAGILQKKHAIEDTAMTGVMAVDIQTGSTCSLNKPTAESWKNRECSLDRSILTETTAILRRAALEGADLIVVEKFGDEEAHGGGLSEDILHAIASGIPVLVAVPESNLSAWNDRTGGTGNILAFTDEAFRDWWRSSAG